MYGEFPELRNAVQWFISLMAKGEWKTRRQAAARRLYQSLSLKLEDPSDKGRFFDERDLFGWYLFLGEAFTDHPWNYELLFGCHVVPVLAAIGRNLDLLLSIKGFERRARRIIASDRSQPNGALFEMLVAAAYARDGWNVTFRAEQPGIAKSYDLDVEKCNARYAVECKRMEDGAYVEMERMRMRELFKSSCNFLVKQERSAIFDLRFKVELPDVPDNYLFKKTQDYIFNREQELTWNDEISNGMLKRLDLAPIQNILSTDFIVHPSPRFTELLTGSYRRYDSSIHVARLKFGPTVRLVDDVDLAVVARYESLSEAAIDKKARDIITNLAAANDQLPIDKPGIVHIGFECLSGDDVEQRRYEKIINRVKNFDRKNSGLEFVYCHYLAPEASPTETWAFDETVAWHSIRPTAKPLSDHISLIAPENTGNLRSGVHWLNGQS